jgi:hypothetical protein
MSTKNEDDLVGSKYKNDNDFNENNVNVDDDYRGFIFVLHEEYGLMLLLSTRKEAKGPHFQTPGGHVEDYELIEAGT